MSNPNLPRYQTTDEVEWSDYGRNPSWRNFPLGLAVFLALCFLILVISIACKLLAPWIASSLKLLGPW